MATDYYPTSTDPPPAIVAERDAMVRLAERWETEADNLADSMSADVLTGGAHRWPPAEVETLRRCAFGLHRTLRAGRRGPQSGSADS